MQRIRIIPRPNIPGGEAVGGFFTLSWNGRGPTRPIPAHADAEQVQAFAEEDLAGIGTLSVTQTEFVTETGANTFEVRCCACVVALGDRRARMRECDFRGVML